MTIILSLLSVLLSRLSGQGFGKVCPRTLSGDSTILLGGKDGTGVGSESGSVGCCGHQSCQRLSQLSAFSLGQSLGVGRLLWAEQAAGGQDSGGEAVPGEGRVLKPCKPPVANENLVENSERSSFLLALPTELAPSLTLRVLQMT